MKIKKLRRDIREQLLSGGEPNLTDIDNISKLIQNHAQEAISLGREVDADAIAFFIVIKDSVKIALFVGRSMLIGPSIKEYLSDYHDQVSEHTKHCIEWLTENASDDLKKDNYVFIPLRDNDSDRWRAFRGTRPMTIDEVKSKAMGVVH